MQAATLYRLIIGLIIACSLLSGYALLPNQVRAEDVNPSEISVPYSREELAQMLAPIALYPDALLSQILMASTYPIEVVEAARWRKRNPHLRDEALDDELAGMDWDPSVKALCHFPDLMALMSERIGDTTDLGNAFLAQEGQVMDTIQELRAAAYASGNLASGARQTVVVEKETIVIEPADRRLIYVPYYDPYTIYGRWRYPAYAPWYWGPPGDYVGFGIGYWPGFYFSFSYGNWSYFDWHRRHIRIDIHKRPRYVRHPHWYVKPGRWHHVPGHRRGVAYRDRSTARKYGQAPRASHDRRDTRGFQEHRVPNRSVRHIDRQRLERQWIDRERSERTVRPRQRQYLQEQKRATVERRREKPAVEANRSIRTRIESERRQREQADRTIRETRQIDRNRQPVPRSEVKQDQRLRNGRQQALEVGSQRQRRQRTPSAQRLEGRQQRRDNVFNTVRQGARERPSGQGMGARREGRSP